MDDRCSLQQIAKVVILSAMDPAYEEYLMEHENPSVFKSLDTFMCTVYIFSTLFDVKYEKICKKYKKIIPTEQFENFLDPRCEILAEGNGYYELFLSCSFVREMVHKFRINFSCCHFDSIAYKYLTKFLKRRFECLEHGIYWNGLLDYCREINMKMAGYRYHGVPLPRERSAGSSMSNDEKFSDESDEHTFVRTAHFNAFTPPQFRSNVLKRIKKCETGFECEFPHHEMANAQIKKECPSSSAVVSGETDRTLKSQENVEGLMDNSNEKIQSSFEQYKVNSQNDTEDCLECRNRCSFKAQGQKWKMAIHQRYKNWYLVSDYFEREESDESMSS
ncbi:hypothetical protein HNY73_004815 [Argiope bruennichi]|uniref:Uncharacterized protein n=1 Tax=Argiope bruennichi TaxID=94029 RepID=A0A8T0FRR5_ARGBR|nr:hypothetical protein HNY73_004815 [Argiope bruennichi]